MITPSCQEIITMRKTFKSVVKSIAINHDLPIKIVDKIISIYHDEIIKNIKNDIAIINIGRFSLEKIKRKGRLIKVPYINKPIEAKDSFGVRFKLGSTWKRELNNR